MRVHKMGYDPNFEPSTTLDFELAMAAVLENTHSHDAPFVRHGYLADGGVNLGTHF